MLTKIREKSQGALAWVILTLICVPFALWGINNYLDTGKEAPVASVGDKDFYQRDVNKAYEQYSQNLQGMGIDEQTLKAQALQKLIKDEVLLQYVHAEKLVVTDDDAREFIKSLPYFQVEGKFSDKQFKALLSSQRISSTEFVNRIKNALTMEQFQHSIVDSSFATQYDVESFFKIQNQQRDVDYVAVPVQSLTEQPTAEDISTYYQQHQDLYQTPEQVSVEYVELALDEIAKKVVVSDEKLKAYYEEQKDQFTTPERRKISHILFTVNDKVTDNDAIAGTGNRPKAQTIKLENVVSRTVAQQIAYRRAVEIYSTPHTVPSFQTTRETRNPAFHPGRSFIMDGSQYRVTSWKPEMNGTTCEIGAVLDQYGDTSVTFDPDGGGDSLVVPPADPPMPDLFFSPYIIPRSEWPAINTPVFAVPRVRANDAVSGAAIWISNTSSGTYNQIGTQDQASAGGLLLSDMNNSAGVLVTGPAISPYTDNDDITSVPDLTGDDVDYNNGALTVLIDSEIMLLESVTANDDGSYTLNNVTRGAFNTTVINHSAGTPVVIVQYADVTPNSSPLLAALSPAGGTLWIKTQPTDGNTWVDLSIVTPEPLGVPENLLATIQITAPYGNQIATLGRPLVISWITSNLIGTLDIAWSEDGVTWNPIATGVADTGSYSWIVNAPASTTAQIRVSSDPSPLVYATSYPFIIGGVTVTPDVMSDTPMAFNGPSGTNWPAGVYIVSYVNGSVNYNTGAGAYFTVNGPTSIQEYVVTYNGSSGAVSVPGPGLYAVFSTTAPVEAVNAGQQISIIHFGGEMTVACADSYYPDNAAGTPATTFGLSQ